MNTRLRRCGIAVAVQFVIVVATLANSPPAPVPVLMPVAVAHAVDSAGFVWKSNASFLFTGRAPIFVEIGSTTLRIEGGERGSIPITDDAGIHGLILYVPADDVGSFFGSSHVYRAEAPGSGAVIPLVRRSDLTAQKSVNLLSVPIARTARTLVRVYDMSLSGDTDVAVNVYSPSGDRMSTAVVHLGMPAIPFPDFPSRPAYGEYVPQVDPTSIDSISIEIVPLTDSSLLWSFTTTTDSSTEAVTAVFPAR